MKFQTAVVPEVLFGLSGMVVFVLFADAVGAPRWTELLFAGVGFLVGRALMRLGR